MTRRQKIQIQKLQEWMRKYIPTTLIEKWQYGDGNTEKTYAVNENGNNN